MEIKDIILNLREENQLSQKALADKIGVDQKTISRWERGTQFPSYEALRQFCEIFNINPDFILGYSSFDGELSTPTPTTALTNKSPEMTKNGLESPNLAPDEVKLIDYLKYMPAEPRAALINFARLQAIRYGDYPDEKDNPNGKGQPFERKKA